MRRIGIVARGDRAEAREVTRGLVQWLTAHGREVVLDTETAGALGLPGVTVAERRALPGKVDLIVVLGGDGTLLSVARLVDGLGVPILGVNLGGLGFLTATTLEALFPTLEAVLRGEYEAEERLVLVAELMRGGTRVTEHLALNDVVVAKGALGRLIDLDVRADGEPMTASRADGLIIATPTGSTAYSFSAGGPLVDHSIEAILMTPVASHSLFARTMVLAPDSEVKVRVRRERRARASLDKVPLGEADEGDVVVVTRAPEPLRFVRFEYLSFPRAVTEKFHLG